MLHGPPIDLDFLRKIDGRKNRKLRQLHHEFLPLCERHGQIAAFSKPRRPLQPASFFEMGHAILKKDQAGNHQLRFLERALFVISLKRASHYERLHLFILANGDVQGPDFSAVPLQWLERIGQLRRLQKETPRPAQHRHQ